MNFGEAEDLCLLEIEPKEKMPGGAVPATFLSPGANLSDLPVRILGFPKDGSEGDWIEGEIKGETARGWLQMNHALTSAAAAPGYSGAPAWDKKTNKVAGIVVAMTERDGHISARLISPSLISGAFPDLFSSGPKDAAPDLGPQVHLLCDREKEDLAFHDFLLREECSCGLGRPHIIVIRADTHDSPVGLVERFFHTRVGWWLKTHSGRDLPGHRLRLGWPVDGSLEELRKTLVGNLLHKIQSGASLPYFGDADPASKFAHCCRSLKYAEYGAVIIVHEINTAAWRRGYADLVRWYVRDFWPAVAVEEELPAFQVFLCLNHPDPSEMGTLTRYWWKRSVRPAIQRDLEALEREVKGSSCLYLKLEGLGPVTPDHVHNWFLQHDIPIDESERRRRTAKLFAGRRAIPMQEVEEFLGSITKEIRRRAAKEE